MNLDEIQGRWKQLRGSAKERWGRLTDDDLEIIDGRTDKLIGKLQERYGVVRAEAEHQLEAWARQIRP